MPLAVLRSRHSQVHHLTGQWAASYSSAYFIISLALSTIFYLSFWSLFLTLFCFLPQISLSQMCLFCSGSSVSMNFLYEVLCCSEHSNSCFSSPLQQISTDFSYCEACFACLIHMYRYMYRLHIDCAYLECKLAFWISSSSKERP